MSDRKILVKYSSVGWIEVKGDGPDHDPLARVFRFDASGAAEMALLRDVWKSGDAAPWHAHAYRYDQNFIFA